MKRIEIKYNRFSFIPVVALLLALALATPAFATSFSITSGFNGTSVADTSSIWFNSHLTSVSGYTGSVTLYFTNQFIKVTTQGGTSYTLSVPDSAVTLSAMATAAVSYSNGWFTTSSFTGQDPFMSGYAWDVPTGVDPKAATVTWSGDFSSSQSGVSLNWQWSAAAYTNFSTNYNALGVTPVDASGLQSGTPVYYEKFVTGGARGGGGSNFTGSNSATGSASNLPSHQLPETSTSILIAFGLLSIAGFYKKLGRAPLT